jgi:hypothetical protein
MVLLADLDAVDGRDEPGHDERDVPAATEPSR